MDMDIRIIREIANDYGKFCSIGLIVTAPIAAYCWQDPTILAIFVFGVISLWYFVNDGNKE